MRHIPVELYLALIVFLPGSVYGLWVICRRPRENVNLVLVQALAPLFIDVEPTKAEIEGLARQLKAYTRREIWHTYWRFVVPAFGPALVGGQYGTYTAPDIRKRFDTQTTSDRFWTAALFWWVGLGVKSHLERALRTKVHGGSDPSGAATNPDLPSPPCS